MQTLGEQVHSILLIADKVSENHAHAFPDELMPLKK